MIMKQHKHCVKFINFTQIWDAVALWVITDQKMQKSSKSVNTKNLKNSQPIPMDTIRSRACANRNSSATWNLDSTHELVKRKFEVSGTAYGQSRCIV